MLFFLLTAFFRVPFERLYVHRGGDLMPLPFTLPRPLFIATPTKILQHVPVYFCIRIHRSIKNWPSGVSMGWGLCGRGLEGVTFVGMALASKASYSQAQRSRPQGHAYKVLVPFEIPEGRFLIDRWMRMQKSTDIMHISFKIYVLSMNRNQDGKYTILDFWHIDTPYKTP